MTYLPKGLTINQQDYFQNMYMFEIHETFTEVDDLQESKQLILES